jgi:hypothetical protein
LSYGSKKFEGGAQKAEIQWSNDAQQTSPLFFNPPFLPLQRGPMERLALSWGKCARQFTKLLLSLLSHIGVKMACHP